MTRRGFPRTEYEDRTARAQKLMADAGLEALLLTTEPEVRYFTGYLTRFWESPTRPWFLIVPANGKPVAVIPSIGANLMQNTWISDIRTWSSPDLEDDGIGLLAHTLCELTDNNGLIGVPDGHEMHVRMPLANLERMRKSIGKRLLKTDHGIIRKLRMIKSADEIAKIERACTIAGQAFARVPEFAKPGTSMERIFREFQMLCLEEGADWVPYLAGSAGKGGYEDVISPARDTELSNGDVLMLDTGLVWDGYFCDYDRNWSIGTPAAEVKAAHTLLVEASDAAFEVARTNTTATQLFQAMDKVLSRFSDGTNTGRLGHGLGMSLTEWPSLMAADETILKPGMVLTLEPCISLGDKMLVHEENIVITEKEPRYLSPRIGAELPVL